MLHVLVLVCCLPMAAAHAVLVHPAPRLDSDGSLKQYPCGKGTQYNAFTMGGTTTLKPGLQNFTFRETVNHNGAPYRLAISFDTDDLYDTHVLLDHIPHNDAGSISGEGKMHRVVVDIPDLDCVNRVCAIQLVQIMTDKFTGTCEPNKLSSSCGKPSFVYFSCGNVEIAGTKTPEEVGEFYRAVNGATTAYGWSQETAEWKESTDGFWEMVEESVVGTTNSPTVNEATESPTATSQPSTNGKDDSSAAPRSSPILGVQMASLISLIQVIFQLRSAGKGLF